MFSFLARPRALALSLSLLTLTPYSYAQQDSLFTSSVTYCNPPETLLIQRFEIAYFPKNSSVSFNVSAASVQANVNVTANIFLNVYGLNPVNITLDLCGILGGALCPLPMYNFTGADSLTLPASLGVVNKIPGIAYKIPDLEGFAQLTLREVKTGAIKACVQATLSNGRSAHQPAVEWATGGVTLAALLIAAWQSMLSPKAIVPFRLLELMYLYQSVASSAFLDLNYPSVYRAFAINFSWAMGLIPASLDSSLQNSINRMRHLTGGNLADAIGGSAVGLVNRKLSPYNTPSANLVSNSFGPILSRAVASSDFVIDFSTLGFAPHKQLAARDTIVNGIVQTVTAASSNVLQAGLPIYVNTLHIATANAFTTAFLCALIVLAIAIGVFILGYGVLLLVERHTRKHNSGIRLKFDYQSFIVSWFIRLVLVMAMPLFIFVFYQWTLKDSWLSTLLSVIAFLAISAALIYPSFLTLRMSRQESPPALYARNSTQLNRNGPLYAQYRSRRFYFFVPILAAFLLRAIAISFAKGSGEAQLALLIAIELGLVLAHFVLKPAYTKCGDVFGTYLAILRLVCTALLIAFLEKLQVKAIPRVVIGIVIALAWSVAVLVVIGNIVWNAIAAIKTGSNGRGESASMLESPTGSEGSMLEKGLRGGSTKSDLVVTKERSQASGSGDSLPYAAEGTDIDTIEEVARGRPVNPTPENNIPFDQYIYNPYPISPTATISTTMEPPSIYSRESGTITVGSLLPRRWSFSFSQPGSPVGSTYQYRSSLTPSPMPPSTPSETSHNYSGGVSRNTSMRVQQHQPKHEDIQEEDASIPSLSPRTPATS